MGQISDDRLLKIERVRSAIISFLKRIGYEVEDEADFDELLPIINGVDKNALLRNFLDGSYVGEYVDDKITYIKPCALYNNYGLKKIELPKINNIPANFAVGIMLKDYFITNAVTLSNQALSSFGSLKGFIFKRYIWAGSYAYLGTASNYPVPIVDLQSNIISAAAVSSEQSLLYGPTIEIAIIRSDDVCKIGNTNAINKNIKEIYVPQALLNDYLTATNWSALPNIADRLKPIEGSKYESLTWYEEEENQNGSN